MPRKLFKCRDHDLVPVSTSESGKVYYICTNCKYKTDWNPKKQWQTMSQEQDTQKPNS